MSIFRRFLLAFTLIAGLAPAFAQAPPPVPAMPDAERRTTYSITASTCNCAVGFALYGDSTDYANWLTVWVNGAQIAQTGNWTITSPTGQLSTIPRPITDAVLTFAAPQTGTVQIVGARRPRRTSQFTENRGVAARDLNQIITDLETQNRENWDRSARTIQAPPGETLSLLPSASSRALQYLSFDASGNPIAGLPAASNPPISSVMQPVVAAASIASAQSQLGILPNAHIVSSGSDLNAAVAAAGSTPTTIQVNVGTTLSASLIVPANVTLWVPQGSMIFKASTYTLTIKGGFIAGTYQVFSGFTAGDVTFSQSVPECYAEWWGALFNAEDTAAIQSAMDAGPPVRLLNGTYNVNVTGLLVNRDGVIVRGAGKERTNINNTSVLPAVIAASNPTTATRFYAEFSDFSIHISSTTAFAIDGTSITHSTFQRILFSGNSVATSVGLKIAAGLLGTTHGENNVIVDCYFGNFQYGILLSDGGNNNSIQYNRAQSNVAGAIGVYMTSTAPNNTTDNRIYGLSVEYPGVMTGVRVGANVWNTKIVATRYEAILIGIQVDSSALNTDILGYSVSGVTTPILNSSTSTTIYGNGATLSPTTAFALGSINTTTPSLVGGNNYNVASIANPGTGQYTVTMTNPSQFGDSEYKVMVSIDAGGTQVSTQVVNADSTHFTIYIFKTVDGTAFKPARVRFSVMP